MQGARCNFSQSDEDMYRKTANGIEENCKHKDIDKADVEAFIVEQPKQTSIQLNQTIKRCLIVLLILALTVAVISLSILLLQHKSKLRAHGEKSDVCLTSSCITVASRLIETANFSADPCHDFFEYSCGGWKASNFLPDSKSEWGGFFYLREKAANIVKRALTSQTSNTKTSAVGKLWYFFQSCLDETRLNTKGGEPLLKLLKSQGTWPLLNSTWDEKAWSQTNAFVRNHNLFFSYYHHGRPAPIFNSCVKVDDKNSSEHIIEIDEPQFTLVPYLYKSNLTRWNELYAAYEKMMTEYIKLLGGNSTSLDVKEILKMEMSLANVSTPSEKFRDVTKTYRRMNLSSFIKEVGDTIDWLTYLKETFKPLGVTVKLDMQIATRSLDYFKKVDQILKSSQKRTIANYLAWIIVYTFAPHLSADFRNANFQFRKAISGVNKDDAHWRKCFTIVQDNMDMAVASVFVEAAFDKKKKEVAKQIMVGFKEEFIRVIKSSDWMDAETKLEAEQKAQLMIEDIGYPDFVTDKNKLNAFYKDFTVESDDYFQNLLNSYQLRRKKNLELLKQPVNKRQWDIPPTEVNAYYDVANNKMVFLAGLMDVPFFEVNGPMSVKYSSFGFVVGHETTHGFDDQGRLYDKNGNLRSWWSQKSADNFRKKANCIEKQFSSYKYLGLSVNGKQTLGENLADLGGLEVAYRAYKHWEKVNGAEAKLPGLNLTSDQLFFLSYAQVWCTIHNKKRGREIILHDLHSLPELRASGPPSNMDEFSKAFSCPSNSKMNRKDKCKLW